MANAKFTDKDLRLKLQKAIEEMEKIVLSEKADENKKGYAANTMNGLIKTYKDKFNVAPEVGEGGVRKASGKKGF